MARIAKAWLSPTDPLLSSTLMSCTSFRTQTRSIGSARAGVADPSLIVKSGLHQRVRSGFREMPIAKPLKSVSDMQKGVAEVVDFIEAKPGQKRLMATLPL